LVITTHSPYVLSKLNNLLFAGNLIKRMPELTDSVKKIVPESAILQPDFVRSYAIQEGYTKNLIDEDGLIDGEYLDSISGHIAEQFNSLLMLERGGGTADVV